jgi:flagellar hook-associated protein 3 FlgL
VRITNQVLLNYAIGSNRKIMTGIGDTQRAIVSGLRVERPSDDPDVVGRLMETSSSLRASEQYNKNLTLARSRLSMEDMALDQITNYLTRAKELAVSQGGSTASAATRATVKEEVDGLREAIIELANTQFAGSYMFAGDYSDQRPFSDTGADPTRPPTGTLSVEVGPGELLETNHSGQEIFVDSNVLDALEALSAALGNDSGTEIQASISGLDQSFDAIQQTLSDLGGRITRVERAMESLDALEVEQLKQESELRDVDMEEAITKLANLQVTYEAAMLANSRILNLTLTDYLR